MNYSNYSDFADENKYILYVRKSTDTSDKQVQSLDDQIRVMSEQAERRGLNIVETIVESKSAKMPNSRSGFKQMVDLIESKKANGILSYAFDRLSRNPVDSASIKWLLQTEKIKRIVTNGRDYLPEDNALLLSIEDGMANEYIRKLKRDIRRGMVSKFKKGIYPSMAPIGYYNCPYDKDIKPDKTCFYKIRKMWDMALSGKYSIPQIHNIAANEWHFVTPKRKKLGGTLISRSLIYKIFHNRFYTGEMKWDGMVNQGIHKPMVTIKEFEAVQKIMKKRIKNNSPKYVHAFGGLMRCKTCNCQITPELQKKGGKEYTYYHCTGRSKYKECDQIKKRVTGTNIEKQFLDQLGCVEIKAEFHQLAVDYILNESNSKKSEEKENITTIQNALSKAKIKKAKITELLIEELIDKEDFKERLEEIKKEVIRLNLKLANVRKPKTINYNELLHKLGLILNIREAFLTADKKQKKEIIENLTTNVFLQDKKLNFEISPIIKPIQEFNNKYNNELPKKKHSKNSLVKLKASHSKRNLDYLDIRSRWCNTIKEVCKIYRDSMEL